VAGTFPCSSTSVFVFGGEEKIMNVVIQSTLLENEMVKYLVEGLWTTLAWKANENEIGRKLATLRFIAHCFQRHMDRLMTLEECDGYMEHVLTRSPKLEKTVAALKQDREYFRKETTRIVQDLDQCSPSEKVTLTRVSDDLIVLLTNLDRHNGKEADALEEAFEREEGGEG
jgi:hypothetical protein